jgi:hypothetical protein
MKNENATHTYVIAHDEYMGVEPDIYQFVGTFRELLLQLFTWPLVESEPDFASMDTETLVQMVVDGNGDGQPYYMVWDATLGKKVLG